MNLLSVFNDFEPFDIFEKIPINTALASSVRATNLIICGELHGVKQNADLAYSMAVHLNIKSIAIERLESEYSDFISSAFTGNPDFTLIDTDYFFSSVLSAEMLKTLYTLYREGYLKQLLYIDSTSEDVEHGIAKNILQLKGTTLCLLGNWHTTDEANHTSALSIVRRNKTVTFIEYRYGHGTYYNLNTGLDNLKDEEISTYKIENLSKHSFTITIPNPSAIEH